MAEPRLQGWDRIAPVLGWTVRTAIRHRLELREHKAIFYQWLGKPPRKTVCSYESLLRLFLVTREDSAAPGARNVRARSRLRHRAGRLARRTGIKRRTAAWRASERRQKGLILH